MEYSPEELNKCRLKKNGRGIHELPIHEDLLEHLPDISVLDNFNYPFLAWGTSEETRIIARNKIIRYINFMYSHEITCIRNQHHDLKAQKAECAILAGFEYDPLNGKFQDKVEDMMACKNDIINRMIVAFVRHNYKTKFTQLVMYREKCYEGMNSLLNNHGATPKELMAWGEAVDTLETKESEILSGDDSPKITAALVTKIEEETLGLRPEDIAYKIKDGKSPLDEFDFYSNK